MLNQCPGVIILKTGVAHKFKPSGNNKLGCVKMALNKILSPNNIREILNKNNLAPRKSLGQNFLIDSNVLMKIVEAGSIISRDLVLEIGPGL